MKRLLLAILTIVYLGTTTGATIHLHYCMGQLVNASFWHTDGDKCGACGMEKLPGDDGNQCCKDKQEQVKLQDDQQAASSFAFQAIQAISAAVLPTFYEFSGPATTSLAPLLPVSNSPPRSKGKPVYLLIQNFRI